MVPYLASEAGRGVMQYGPTPAEVLYAGYKDAKWAARRIQRAFRKRRATKKRKLNTGAASRVGEAPRVFNSKREQNSSITNVLQDTRTLYQWELTQLAAGTNREDQRSRHLINCKGFQIAFHVFNLHNEPFYLNIAVIAPKHSNELTIIDFFRGVDGARGNDFDTSLSALEMHFHPINTDKYTILKHDRTTVGPRVDSNSYNSDTGFASYITRNFWIPVKRQLRYDNTLGTSCTTPIFLVYWMDFCRSVPNAGVANDLISVSHMNTMFYTDVV